MTLTPVTTLTPLTTNNISACFSYFLILTFLPFGLRVSDYFRIIEDKAWFSRLLQFNQINEFSNLDYEN